MRICVLSDVHYKYAPSGKDDLENSAAILNFLQQAIGRYDLLVLNGDVFDLWYDWKFTIIKQYFPLLHRLASIIEAGCKVVMISGNHDFWFGDFFPAQLGVDVVDKDYILKADGKKMLFTHGDLHTCNDLRYQIFRRLIRLSPIKTAFSLLHPDFALYLGSSASRTSRKRKIPHVLLKRKSAGLASFASSQLRKHGIDIVCMGHSHKPQILEIDGGVYANSGDWVVHRSYLEIIDGKVILNTYDKGVKDEQNLD